MQLLSDYALSLIRGYQETKEEERIGDLRWFRRDGAWIRMPEVGDQVWFIGDSDTPELQGILIITSIRKEIGQVTVKPVVQDDEDEGAIFNGWAVWWKDITYEEPPEPTEQYLYGIMDE